MLKANIRVIFHVRCSVFEGLATKAQRHGDARSLIRIMNLVPIVLLPGQNRLFPAGISRRKISKLLKFRWLVANTRTTSKRQVRSRARARCRYRCRYRFDAFRYRPVTVTATITGSGSEQWLRLSRAKPLCLFGESLARPDLISNPI